VTAHEPALEVRDVGVRFHAGTPYEVAALDAVSLAVRRGTFLAVAGPSGCGKTTLLAVLGAMLRPTSGVVVAGGRDLADAAEAERSRVRRRFGFAFQSAPMLRGLPLWENVTYGLVPLGATLGERRTLGSGLLDRVGLSARAHAPPEELSGGERQRAGLARALAGNPETLFVDEPTASLDRGSAETILAIVSEFHAAGGTVVMASHDPGALACARDHVHLDRGRVTQMRFAPPPGSP
jgi:putative ABC transport system ATP-binding protein